MKARYFSVWGKHELYLWKIQVFNTQSIAEFVSQWPACTFMSEIQLNTSGLCFEQTNYISWRLLLFWPKDHGNKQSYQCELTLLKTDVFTSDPPGERWSFPEPKIRGKWWFDEIKFNCESFWICFLNRIPMDRESIRSFPKDSQPYKKPPNRFSDVIGGQECGSRITTHWAMH